MPSLFNKQSGFTLVEMIMVIVITGIIGGIVAVFLKAPIQQYMDVARRAELTDIADTAIRRMARDVRIAVPNSVRFTNCTAPCVEFLPTKDGGRYRANPPGNVLTFGTGGSNIFDIIGTAINFVAGAAPDYIVIGSTQSDGNPPYDTSVAGILRAYTGAAGAQTTVNFTATALPIWAELPSQRFDVVDGAQRAVTYACVGGGVVNGDGTGNLMRYSNYGFNVAPTSVTPAILASKVDCTKTSIEYDIPNQRFGLLAVRLTLTSGGESVSLYNEIHVNNAP
ncbi:MAG: prepilin-type N-terminal cleavage/methylation domain-containing protein [Gallionella sp.]|nr:prepilin-type N-terminal cleavage/methylation domain-containing protein [Gallionella sp.]